MSRQEFEIDLTPSLGENDRISKDDELYYQNKALGTIEGDEYESKSIALFPRTEFQESVHVVELGEKRLLIRDQLPSIELLGGLLIGHKCQVAKYITPRKLHTTMDYIQGQMSIGNHDRSQNGLPFLTADEVMGTILRRHLLFALKDAPQPNYESIELPDPPAIFGVMIYAMQNLSQFHRHFHSHPQMLVGGMSLTQHDGEMPNWQSVINLPEWMLPSLHTNCGRTIVMPDNQRYHQSHTEYLPIQSFDPIQFELVFGGSTLKMNINIKNTAPHC